MTITTYCSNHGTQSIAPAHCRYCPAPLTKNQKQAANGTVYTWNEKNLTWEGNDGSRISQKYAKGSAQIKLTFHPWYPGKFQRNDFTSLKKALGY